MVKGTNIKKVAGKAPNPENKSQKEVDAQKQKQKVVSQVVNN